MTIDEIVRKQAGTHLGYQLNTISISRFTVQDLSLFRRLKTIPGKITAFLHRAKIREVFKSDHAEDPRDDYYLVRATDDTLFHVRY